MCIIVFDLVMKFHSQRFHLLFFLFFNFQRGRMEIILKLVKLPFLVENFLLTSIHVNEVCMYVCACVWCMYIYTYTHMYVYNMIQHLLQAYCILEVRII